MTELRKAQAPLTVGQVAQTAALASLGQPGELERRRSVNTARRHHLVGALGERGLPMAESHTNFVYFELGDRVDSIVEDMTSHGVIIRPMSGGWARVTIGSDEENRRFLEALDSARAGH
jgi:histidinol-phosphate aminotransferase